MITMPTFEVPLRISVHIHIYIPSFRLVGGFLVAQLVRIDLEPSHCPFIRAIAFSASTFFVNETNPYPFDFRVWGSRTTRQSLQNEIMRSNKTNLYSNMIKCYSFVVAHMELKFSLSTQNRKLNLHRKFEFLRLNHYIFEKNVKYTVSWFHSYISTCSMYY